MILFVSLLLINYIVVDSQMCTQNSDCLIMCRKCRDRFLLHCVDRLCICGEIPVTMLLDPKNGCPYYH
ncbi:hypothetical protein P8452_59122 [Trifolium repens]|nr:hypothetical protein P8452_59122 [Trifolium repens]